MNSPVQKIKERLSIEEVVSSYIKLDRAGVNLKARCPFHNEKSASFFVSPDRGSYYCFGCGAGGDIFSFVEQFEGLDFKGSLKLLADRAGVPLESYTQETKENKSEKERLYEIMEEATKYFEANLTINKEAQEYLKARGLNEKSIKDFRVGFAILDWRKLYDHLKSKNFTDKEIELAGLAKHPEDKSKGMYDRFRGRVMFPMADSSGRIVAFSGRIFVDDGKSAKYLNSPETPIFKKSAILYGLDKAKLPIKKNDFSIIVEGQFDLILSHQAGFKNTVATSGTALTDTDHAQNNTVNNLGLISRLSQNIVFIFDGDMAGFKASIRATPIAMALFSDMNVKATQIPEGMDPADLISKKGPEAWREVVRNSKHIIEFLLDAILQDKKKDMLKVKLEINDKIIPFLLLINNPVKQSHFISMVSNKSGMSEDDVRDRLKQSEQQLKHEKAEIKEIGELSTKMYRKDSIERKLLGIALWQQSLKEPTLDFESILNKLGTVVEKYNNIKQDLLFEAEVFYTDNANLKISVEEMFANLEEENINETLTKKMQELVREPDEGRGKEILQEINELNKQKEKIKNNRIKK